ncbi:unnamed protein product [Ixodes persulcatus]
MEPQDASQPIGIEVPFSPIQTTPVSLYGTVNAFALKKDTELPFYSQLRYSTRVEFQTKCEHFS